MSALIFYSIAFSQINKTIRIFEKNIDIVIPSCYGEPFSTSTSYSISLLSDSTYRINCFNTAFLSDSWAVGGRYCIVENTIIFNRDSTKGFYIQRQQGFDPILQKYNAPSIVMELADKKLANDETGIFYEVEVASPFYQLLQTKKSALALKGRKTLLLPSDYLISPQLSNKTNSF